MTGPRKVYQDSILPANYIGYRDICRAEGIKNEEHVRRLAKDTLFHLDAEFRRRGYNDWKKFAAFYNTHSNGLTTNKSINRFYDHTKLQPIAHLMHFFVKNHPLPSGGYELKCDFGMLKSHYDFYRKNNRAPDVLNRGRLNKYNIPADTPGRSKIRFDRIKSWDVPKTQVYITFLSGLNAMNKQFPDQRMTLPELVLLALQEFIDHHPNIFGRLDKKIDESAVRRKDARTVSAQVEPSLSELMGAFVERYNAKADIPITQSDFVASAIKAHLLRQNVEFIDPELSRRLKNMENG